MKFASDAVTVGADPNRRGRGRLTSRARALCRVALAATLALMSTAALGACSSGPTRPEEGIRVDIPENRPELGPLEERARAYLVDITDLLEAPTDDPAATVVSIGRYLDVHRTEIESTVHQIEARVATMTPQERVYYEETFGAYFAEATNNWNDALAAFRQQYPEQGSRIDGLMLYFD
jgi:hypothetical protein